MARLLRIFLLLAAAAVASPPTRGAELPAMGPLSDSLLLGIDGAWQGASEGEVYRLANPNDAKAVKHLAVDPRTSGWRGSVAVEIRLDDAEQAVGGLLYGLQAEPLSYFALVIESEGGAALYTRSPGGLERIASFEDAKLDPDGFNSLRIEEGEGEFHVVINGARVGSVGTDLAGFGAVGILAGGRGTFLFRSFALTPAP